MQEAGGSYSAAAGTGLKITEDLLSRTLRPRLGQGGGLLPPSCNAASGPARQIGGDHVWFQFHRLDAKSSSDLPTAEAKLYQVSFVFNVEATDPYLAALEAYKALITAMDDGKLGAVVTDSTEVDEELVLDIAEADAYAGVSPLVGYTA